MDRISRLYHIGWIGLDRIVSYWLDEDTLAFMHWLVTARMGRMGQMDWMGGLVGRGWEGLKLAPSGTGVPPWALEQEHHH